MTKEECKKVVLDIIADIAPDEDLSNVKPDVRLRDQLELDSMDFLDIVMELRKQHGIEVPDSCAEYLTPLFKK
jgi:acyl carrier protein